MEGISSGTTRRHPIRPALLLYKGNQFECLHCYKNQIKVSNFIYYSTVILKPHNNNHHNGNETFYDSYCIICTMDHLTRATRVFLPPSYRHKREISCSTSHKECFESTHGRGEYGCDVLSRCSVCYGSMSIIANFTSSPYLHDLP